MGCCCCVCVKESQIGVIESFGEFSKIAYPGVTCLNCISESMAGTLSLRQEQIKLDVETRSRDNVFITLSLAIQVKVAANYHEFDIYRAKFSETSKRKKKMGDDEILLEQTGQGIGAGMSTSKKDMGILYNAYYRLDRPYEQILAYVEEYFRFHGMQYSLDEMFAAKNDMTHELQEILNGKNESFWLYYLQYFSTGYRS